LQNFCVYRKNLTGQPSLLFSVGNKFSQGKNKTACLCVYSRI
jgi:hypothetical protein